MLFAVFDPEDNPIWQTIDPSFALSMGAVQAMKGEDWPTLRDQGFTVKPVAIVEVSWPEKKKKE